VVVDNDDHRYVCGYYRDGQYRGSRLGGRRRQKAVVITAVGNTAAVNTVVVILTVVMPKGVGDYYDAEDGS